MLAGFEGQAGGAVVGLVLGSGLSVYDYLKGGNSSYRDDTVVSQNNYAKLALEKDDDKVSINTKHDILTDDDMKNAGAGTAVSTGYSGAETVMGIIIGNKILTKEAMNFNERALEYKLKEIWLVQGMQCGQVIWRMVHRRVWVIFLMNFGKESGQVKPRLSNGIFQINGLLLVVSELVF